MAPISHRRETLLFSQDSTQTLQDEDSQRLPDLQDRYDHARDNQDRRTTWTEALGPNEDEQAIQESFNNADTPTEYAAAVAASPKFAFDLTTDLLKFGMRAGEERNVLFEANELNLKKLKALNERYTDVNNQLEELTQTHNSTVDEHRMALQELRQKIHADNSDNPTAVSSLSGQLAVSRKGLEFFREACKKAELKNKDSEAESASLRQEVAEQREKLAEAQEDLLELDDLRAQLRADTNRGRQETTNGRRERSDWELSMERRMNEGMPPPPPPSRRQSRQPSFDRSRDGSRPRRHSRQPSPHRGRDGSRSRREETTFTTRTKSHRLQHGAVYLDSTQELNVLSSRNVKDPEKFSGLGDDTFYPWLQAVELKLASSTCRTMGDALRWVHSWTKDDAWKLLDPSIPSTGSYSTRCVDPFDSVDDLLKELSDRYGDEHQTSKKRAEFDKLRQGDRESFHDFHLKFRSLRAHLGRMSSDDEVWELKRRLNYTLQQRTAGLEFDSIKDLEKKLKALEVDLERIREDNPRKNDSSAKDRTHNSKDTKTSRPAGRAPELPRQSGKPAEVKQYSSYSDLPNDLKKLPFLDRDERARCQKEGLCNRCRKAGHMAHDTHRCPLGILPRKPVNNSTTILNPEVPGNASTVP